MKILRWILFIPMALVIGAILNVLTSLVCGIFLNETWVNINGALFFSVGFFIGGFKIVPSKNNFTKWLLLSILFLTGLLNIVMWFYDSPEAKLSSGIVMIVAVFGFAAVPTQELEEFGDE